MSETQANASTVPEWDLADRMRKALRVADLGVQEIADYLGVGRNTVSTWINGKITPSKQTQRLWALRCGVPFEWLADESAAPQPAPRRRTGNRGSVEVTTHDRRLRSAGRHAAGRRRAPLAAAGPLLLRPLRLVTAGM